MIIVPRHRNLRQDEAEVWIRQVVSQRCSVLPLRLYDITSQQFITRSELLEVVKQTVFEQYRSSRPSLHCLEFMSDADARQKKWFVLYYTKFAILSHTWGSSELSYQKICNGDQVIMHDRKFAGFSRVARDFECRYVWIDTACIDKSSHGELDESIRSMFMWYRMAYVCIVYLESGYGLVDRWFFRGWTLQELLAPKRMSFCGRNWERAFPPPAEAAVSNNGSHPACDVVRKFGLQHYENLDTEIDVEEYDEEEAAFVIPELSKLFIHVKDMTGYQPSPENAKIIFQHMAGRRTSVPEDMAYCLLGLLGIVLPIAYGEGQEHALYRLQIACAERSDNRAILFWDCLATRASQINSMLPRNPLGQSNRHTPRRAKVTAFKLWNHCLGQDADKETDLSFSFTNSGLRIQVILHDLSPEGVAAGKRIGIKAAPRTKFSPCKLAVLGTYFIGHGNIEDTVFAIALERIGEAHHRRYRRIPCNILPETLPRNEILLSRIPEIVYII